MAVFDKRYCDTVPFTSPGDCSVFAVSCQEVWVRIFFCAGWVGLSDRLTMTQILEGGRFVGEGEG